MIDFYLLLEKPVRLDLRS